MHCFAISSSFVCVFSRYLKVNALIARELSRFTCTSSLTMNEAPRAVLKISSSLLVNECREIPIIHEQ